MKEDGIFHLRVACEGMGLVRMHSIAEEVIQKFGVVVALTEKSSWPERLSRYRHEDVSVGDEADVSCTAVSIFVSKSADGCIFIAGRAGITASLSSDAGGDDSL